jgi:pyruvate dehydrogenase E2 component (dihydrolipoamide acetyltransferase)
MSMLLTLPRLGETMESGRVVGWLKRPGETFRRGETIVEIESDKTVVELPALADGRLLEVIAAEGSEVDVGAPLCRYAAAEEATSTPPGAGGGPREDRGACVTGGG